MYVGALKINTNENDEMAKNVTLKQMQPKIFKFSQTRRSPKLSNEFGLGSLY